MIAQLLSLESMRGVRWVISRTDYSWNKEVEYTVLFRFEHGGDDISITRVGRDFEKLFNEAYAVFHSRMEGAFKPFEIYPTAIEAKVVNDD